MIKKFFLLPKGIGCFSDNATLILKHSERVEVQFLSSELVSIAIKSFNAKSAIFESSWSLFFFSRSMRFALYHIIHTPL